MGINDDVDYDANQAQVQAEIRRQRLINQRFNETEILPEIRATLSGSRINWNEWGYPSNVQPINDFEGLRSDSGLGRIIAEAKARESYAKRGIY